jgi:hypothetical protein
MLKTLRTLITEEITSEEELADSSDRLAEFQLQQIIDEIMIYIEESTGVGDDVEYDDQARGELRQFIRDAMSIYWFLRNLMKSGRVLISPIR